MKREEKGRKAVKYSWALLLSLAVAGLALTERESPWAPLLNGLIDLLQQQHQQQGRPGLPAAGQIPTSTGPLNFPSRQKVQPAAAHGPAVAAPDVAPAHQ